MTTIKVPDVGRIIVTDTGRLVEKDGGYRRYRKVSFVYANGGMTNLTIGSAWFDNRTVMEHYSVFDTVSAAISNLVHDTRPCSCRLAPGEECQGAECGDDTGDGEQWEMAEIPIGTIRVTRDEYRIVSDGVTSDRTDGKQRSETLKLTRFYGEEPAEAVARVLGTSVYFEGAGTFDAYGENDATWRTVPVRNTDVTPESEGRYGEAWIEHVVTLSGPVLEWLPAIVRGMKESGAMWR